MKMLLYSTDSTLQTRMHILQSETRTARFQHAEAARKRVRPHARNDGRVKRFLVKERGSENTDVGHSPSMTAIAAVARGLSTFLVSGSSRLWSRLQPSRWVTGSHTGVPIAAARDPEIASGSIASDRLLFVSLGKVTNVVYLASQVCKRRIRLFDAGFSVICAEQQTHITSGACSAPRRNPQLQKV